MDDENISRIFKNMPTIECERLILRPIRVSDAEDVYDYSKRRDLTRYLLWQPHSHIGYTKEYLKYVVKQYRAGTFFDWAIEEKSSGRMIGTCGFASIDTRNRSAEIGYVLNPDFHRRGYAPEAAEAVLDFGFRMLDLNRIQCRFMKGNDASLKVAEKLGMTFEGYLRDFLFVKGVYRTIGFCSILREEFDFKN